MRAEELNRCAADANDMVTLGSYLVSCFVYNSIGDETHRFHKIKTEPYSLFTVMITFLIRGLRTTQINDITRQKFPFLTSIIEYYDWLSPSDTSPIYLESLVRKNSAEFLARVAKVVKMNRR